MRTAPYKAVFSDAVYDVELVTYTNGTKDEIPKDRWKDTLWIGQEEDWYMLTHYRNTTVRVVEREMYLRAREKK